MEQAKPVVDSDKLTKVAEGIKAALSQMKVEYEKLLKDNETMNKKVNENNIKILKLDGSINTMIQILQSLM